MRTYVVDKLTFTVEDLDDGLVKTSLTSAQDENRVSTSMSMTMPPEPVETDADRCAVLAQVYCLGMSGGDLGFSRRLTTAVSRAVAAQEQK